MLLCYVDESGNDQLLDCAEAPPVIALAGVVVAEANAHTMTMDFLRLKAAFNPQLANAELSEVIRTEIKGSDLRADLRSDSRRRKRRATGIIDATMRLLDGHNATLIGSVWVKADKQPLPRYHYADSIADMASDFGRQIAAANTQGLMILDARTKAKNTPTVHGITTRRFRKGGDPTRYLAESPLFGHSDAHVLLQVADIVASALLFPMACHAYCEDLPDNVHTHEQYADVQSRWGSALRALEHRYTTAEGTKSGGVAVRNRRNELRSLRLFTGEDEAVRERQPRRRTRAGQPIPVDTP